jgi:hypothetical protein
MFLKTLLALAPLVALTVAQDNDGPTITLVDCLQWTGSKPQDVSTTSSMVVSVPLILLLNAANVVIL